MLFRGADLPGPPRAPGTPARAVSQGLEAGAATDDDELETARAELEKLRAQNKKLEFKLSQAGRDKTSRDKDAPPPPKRTNKSKSSGESDAGART